MEREGITRAEALHMMKKDDEERRKWSQNLYGIHTCDSRLYDLVIHIHNEKGEKDYVYSAYYEPRNRT